MLFYLKSQAYFCALKLLQISTFRCMRDLLDSKEVFVLLMLASKFVWLYFSGKYSISFLVEFSSTRMLGVRAQSLAPLVWALLWIGFLFFC